MSFTLFNAFPPEIQSLIFDQCSTNDLTCLRLTCKYFYNLTPADLSKKIDLETEDFGPLCGQEVGKDWTARYMHKQQCHALSYETLRAQNERCGRKTPPMKRCRTSRYGSPNHCECFSRRSRLHYRLNSWIGGGLRYCGTCGKFTKRKRGHNGRCYHGSEKPRKQTSNFWTHHPRRGAFGRKLWKMWFNNNAMNRFETRLAKPVNVRKGSGRYDMRVFQPRDVNTVVERDSKSCNRR